ncbi:hypothetical protein [Halobacteriovorax sp. ZH4_bin.1]|uniref:hypothetical protein n=1 Tax=unclassified Halobacteriovorax TaxID=2639665 RepID=UPI00371A3097
MKNMFFKEKVLFYTQTVFPLIGGGMMLGGDDLSLKGSGIVIIFIGIIFLHNWMNSISK